MFFHCVVIWGGSVAVLDIISLQHSSQNSQTGKSLQCLGLQN